MIVDHKPQREIQNIGKFMSTINYFDRCIVLNVLFKL